MPIEAPGKVAESAVSAMKSVPLAIALLLGNVGFLAFAAYVLGEVATNSRERNVSQTALIEKLITDIRDCRAPRQPTGMKSLLYRDSLTPEEIAR